MAKKAQYRLRNWHQYNKALINRGSLSVWVSKNMLKNVTNTPGSHGNQRYPDALIECCLMLRQLYRLTLRATQGFVESVFECLGLDLAVPDYTTLSRRSGNLDVKLKARPGESLRLLVDSTGVQVIGGTQWGRIRHKKQRKQLWRKLHIGVNAESLDICSGLMTESQRLDGNYLAPLVAQINHPIESITGDGAYDKKGCYRTAYQHHAQPIFPPQHHAIIQRNKRKKDPALIPRDELITYLNRGKSYKNRLTRWKIKIITIGAHSWKARCLVLKRYLEIEFNQKNLIIRLPT